jgi:DNA-binding GntR family transcriptional regulator
LIYKGSINSFKKDKNENRIFIYMIFIENIYDIVYDRLMREQNKKLNKQEYAYKIIRERILDGSYSPGYRIVINQIAKELDSSAIPIREALRQLVAENLITYKQFSGAVVTPIDDEQYLDTLTTLAILSGYATALSAHRMSDPVVNELKELNGQMKEALEEFDFVTFGKLNKDFHECCFQFCENKYLLETILNARNRLDTIRRTGSTLLMVRAHDSIEEHEVIISLIEAKAPFAEIETFVKRHMLNTVEAYRMRKKKLKN